MNKGLKSKKYRFFMRFLLSYLLVLLIPLILGSLVYKEALKVVEEDAINANMAILRQSRDILDRRLSEMDGIILQLAMNPKVNRMLYIENQPDFAEIYGLNSLVQEMQYYSITSNLISELFIFFKNSEIAISPQTLYNNFKLFYGYIFKYENMEYAQWYDEILGKYHRKDFLPAMPANINSKRRSVITYMHSVPLGSYNYFKGTICVLIDEEEIHKLLSRLQIDNGGWAYVADENGKILTSITSGQHEITAVDVQPLEPEGFMERMISGEQMTITYTRSTGSGITYVAAIPSHVVMAKVKYIKQITIKTILWVLLSGVLIALFLAYRNSRPFQEIVKMLRERLSTDSSVIAEEDFLQGTIARLIENNRALQIAVQEQAPMLRSAFFNALFKGEFNNLHEIEARMAYIGLDIKGKMYAVAVLRISHCSNLVSRDILEELNVSRVALKEILSGIMNDRTFMHYAEEDKIALFFSHEAGGELELVAYIEDIVTRASDKLYADYSIRVFSAIGGIFENLLYMGRSFNEAIQALDYQWLEKDCKLVWFSRIPKENIYFYYPLDLEQRLINLAKAGDKEEVKKLLHHIYEENFSRRKLSASMLHQLLPVMQGTVIKLVEQSSTLKESGLANQMLETVPNLKAYETIDIYYGNLIDKYMQICDILIGQRKSRNKKLIDKIVGYLHSDYRNSNLCIPQVAVKFEITDAYLSQFFREQTGENFSNYLERIRIQHACDYLGNTDASVDEIAGLCGYNNDTSFRRAFKRLTGVSPTAYRDTGRSAIVDKVE